MIGYLPNVPDHRAQEHDRSGQCGDRAYHEEIDVREQNDVHEQERVVDREAEEAQGSPEEEGHSGGQVTPQE